MSLLLLIPSDFFCWEKNPQAGLGKNYITGRRIKTSLSWFICVAI
jgi:hypothetical protein